MTILNVVACPAAPIAHLTVVLAPCMNSLVANGDLSLMTSLALEVGGLVHVAVNATVNAGDGISGGKTVRAAVHCKSFDLKGFF